MNHACGDMERRREKVRSCDHMQRCGQITAACVSLRTQSRVITASFCPILHNTIGGKCRFSGSHRVNMHAAPSPRGLAALAARDLSAHDGRELGTSNRSGFRAQNSLYGWPQTRFREIVFDRFCRAIETLDQLYGIFGIFEGHTAAL